MPVQVAVLGLALPAHDVVAQVAVGQGGPFLPSLMQSSESLGHLSTVLPSLVMTVCSLVRGGGIETESDTSEVT